MLTAKLVIIQLMALELYIVLQGLGTLDIANFI